MHLLQRRWRPRGPWRSTGWSGERCQQNRSLWPLSTGETTPWTSLQRFFTHISSGWGSLPRTRLWPNPGEDSTLLNHISWWCTGFGISWDSWGSSRRPLERLSLLRRSGRRTLSRSRTLVSGWGDCFKCYLTPPTYFRYDSRSGTHNMYREYRDLTVNSAITQVPTVFRDVKLFGNGYLRILPTYFTVLPWHGSKAQGQGSCYSGELYYICYICKTYSYFMTLRSSGARLSRLASAEGHWSPRCMTARSSSLCLAEFPSRVAPSSRPTGQTPTLSRRAPAFMLLHVHVLTQEKLPLFPLNSCEQSRLILLVSEKWGRCLAEMAKQLIQLIIAGGQVNISYHLDLHMKQKVTWPYHAGGGEGI